jgi:hypothetical protein
MDWRSIITPNGSPAGRCSLVARTASRRSVRALFPLAGTIAAVAAFAGSTAPAQAALVGTCNSAPLSEPFAAWGDSNTYELAPGGDFTGGAPGWTLSGGAKLVSGGDPFEASSTPTSLELPAGATAQSPYTCADMSYPLFRFFDRNLGSASRIQVTVLYNNLVLQIVQLPAGTVTTTGSWAPSGQLSTQATLGTLTSLGNARVSLRFTAIGGSAEIDHVYIDPRCA